MAGPDPWAKAKADWHAGRGINFRELHEQQRAQWLPEEEIMAWVENFKPEVVEVAGGWTVRFAAWSATRPLLTDAAMECRRRMEDATGCMFLHDGTAVGFIQESPR